MKFYCVSTKHIEEFSHLEALIRLLEQVCSRKKEKQNAKISPSFLEQIQFRSKVRCLGEHAICTRFPFLSVPLLPLMPNAGMRFFIATGYAPLCRRWNAADIFDGVQRCNERNNLGAGLK